MLNDNFLTPLAEHALSVMLWYSCFLLLACSHVCVSGACRYVRTSLGITGYVLCVFSLLYGGFWRIKIRERFQLPAYTWCCRSPNCSDCFQWLFCSFCSLCQEVRTAESYDVRNDRFFARSMTKSHSPGSSPDCGMRGDTQPVPASFIQPLPNSSMVQYEDGDVLHDKPVDLTMLFPPPDQTVDPVSPFQAHQNSPARSPV